jgi:hypothetical protein
MCGGCIPAAVWPITEADAIAIPLIRRLQASGVARSPSTSWRMNLSTCLCESQVPSNTRLQALPFVTTTWPGLSYLIRRARARPLVPWTMLGGGHDHHPHVPRARLCGRQAPGCPPSKMKSRASQGRFRTPGRNAEASFHCSDKDRHRGLVWNTPRDTCRRRYMATSGIRIRRQWYDAAP